MVYYTCRYAPAELFAGFGEKMERLDPNPKNFECSDSCAHPNLCGFSKAVIEEVNSRNITKIILTDCCDAMRRTYDVLKARPDMKFIYLLPLPHKNGPAEIKLFGQELKELAEAYGHYSGRRFDVQKAADAYRRAQDEISPKPDRPYVSLSGAHGGEMLMEQLKSAMGDVPVVDDTCTGNRELMEKAGSADSFFDWYASALLNMTPCMRMLAAQTLEGANRTPGPDPSSRLLGTVFHTIKFCDYYSFRYMDEKDASPVPLVKIETDTTQQSEGQLKTRLDAFREELGLNQRKIKMQKKEGAVYTAGIDSGSASTDAVVMDENKKILGRAIVPTGAGAANTAQKALEEALAQAGLKEEDLTAMVSTGYGRETIGVDSTSVTEITCHAKGANFLHPEARTVVDIGGQDSKVIRIDENGSVLNFVMNDKCAAGTGRFLEMQARALEMTMPQMSQKGLEWKKDVEISSMCTVFAESEVVSLVAQNVDTADIIHGLNKSVASKTAALVGRIGGKPEFIMTGGVAQNQGVVKCLEEKLGAPIFVSGDAQVCGAIGAALIALESVLSQRQQDRA